MSKRPLLARLRSRFDAGEPERAADELLTGLATGHVYWDHGGWGDALGLLRALPAESRDALVRAVADRFPPSDGVTDLEERLRVLALCALVGDDLPDEMSEPSMISTR